MDVTIVGYNQVCQTSNQSTVLLNVTGGIPPYYVLENVTSVSTNSTISASFVATFNQSSCVNILDSSGCVRPTQVCFRVPDPGPVNLTVVTQNSCKNVATGSASITSDQPITCSYMANNVTIPSIQTCTLVNLPPSAFITVTARTIIGCTAIASFQIQMRPPIVLTLNSRTTQGILDGPCIDNITITISGGDEPPPYTVSLFDDTTNATLNYDNNHTIFITGVCRNYIYTVLAAEGDGSCPVAIAVNDPQFNFGGGGFGILGLPAPYWPYFAPLPPGPIYDKPHMRWAVAIFITVVFVLMILLLLALYIKKSEPLSRPSPLYPSQRRNYSINKKI